MFIAARHGAAPRYPHPDLEPILNDTYGVVIWHEQIIAILAKMTGCDRAAADVARRALADPDRLPKVEQWFRRTASERGYSPAVLDEVKETVSSFGAYGFCRAHAVAFAVPALQSAYLKAHHPAALYAGLLEHDPGMWPRRVIVADARRHGVPVLNVDVNHSRARHSVEQTPQGFGVRLALSTVKGISEQEVARLAAGQPYTSLQDLWQRARPSLPIAQRLIRIGAVDALATDLTRRDLLLQATELHRQVRARATTDGQLPLGGELVTTGPSGLPEMAGRDKLGAELDVLSSCARSPCTGCAVVRGPPPTGCSPPWPPRSPRPAHGPSSRTRPRRSPRSCGPAPSANCPASARGRRPRSPSADCTPSATSPTSLR